MVILSKCSCFQEFSRFFIANGAQESLFLLKLSRIRVLNNKHCPKAKSNQEMTFYTNAKPIEDYLQKMAL